MCPICLIAQKMGKKSMMGNNYWCALYKAPIIDQVPYLPEMKMKMGN